MLYTPQALVPYTIFFNGTSFEIRVVPSKMVSLHTSSKEFQHCVHKNEVVLREEVILLNLCEREDPHRNRFV
jgi:hypothetical protein